MVKKSRWRNKATASDSCDAVEGAVSAFSERLSAREGRSLAGVDPQRKIRSRREAKKDLALYTPHQRPAQLILDDAQLPHALDRSSTTPARTMADYGETQNGAGRACLATLPLEIKARIVEIAFEQDLAYGERWTDGAPGEKLVEVHMNEWRGRSSLALSETSKDFNELAATHSFFVSMTTRQSSENRV